MNASFNTAYKGLHGLGKYLVCGGLVQALMLVAFLLNVSPQEQGRLKGVVGLLDGNCMPSPGVAPCKPKPVEAVVYITQPSENFDLSLLVDSVSSNVNGTFEIALQPGEYSLFTKYQTEVSCAVFRCTPKCVCNPVEIKVDSVSEVLININKASW